MELLKGRLPKDHGQAPAEYSLIILWTELN